MIYGRMVTLSVLLEERSRLTAERARSPLQGDGVVVSLELGRTGSGLGVPGVWSRGQFSGSIYIGPNSAKQCQTVPYSC